MPVRLGPASPLSVEGALPVAPLSRALGCRLMRSRWPISRSGLGEQLLGGGIFGLSERVSPPNFKSRRGRPCGACSRGCSSLWYLCTHCAVQASLLQSCRNMAVMGTGKQWPFMCPPACSCTRQDAPTPPAYHSCPSEMRAVLAVRDSCDMHVCVRARLAAGASGVCGRQPSRGAGRRGAPPRHAPWPPAWCPSWTPASPAPPGPPSPAT